MNPGSLLFSVLFLLLLPVGCSSRPRTYPVRGVVRFSDGAPLTSGSVEFESAEHPEKLTARGEVDEQGRFVLGTFALDDGAVAGKHRVAVISRYTIGTGAERPGLVPMDLLDPRFRDGQKSGLTFTVEPQDNDFVIPVDYAVVEGTEEPVTATSQ